MATASDFLNDENWVHRMDQVFDHHVNSNDKTSLEEWMTRVDDLKKAVEQPDPTVVDNILTLEKDYYSGMGLIQGKQFTREEFRKNLAEFVAEERNKKLNGEEPMLFRLNHAWYDLVDTTKDEMVTLDGYKKLMRVNNFPESAAEAAFKKLDKDMNGKVKRSELNENEFNFWFTPEHQESKGLFGQTFEAKPVHSGRRCDLL